MTAVTIRPTFSKDTRPGNGLEEIADELIADKIKVHYVVGVLKWAGGSLDDEGAITPAVKFLGIEPVTGDAAEQAKQILDQARKQRGLGRMEDAIPAVDPALFDFDGDGRPKLSEAAESRLGPDGPHEVPPPSADEVMAERAEAKAAKSAKPGAKSGAKPTADPFTPGDAA
jgi:hypothetical protein